jgi:hypothetical protein
MAHAGLHTHHAPQYSVGRNFYLNVHNWAPAGPLLPGQVNVTVDQFNQIVSEQTKELWTKFGNLTEIW